MNNKRKGPPHEEHSDETWLIPYADLLTLLLALFIVLYASSTIDSKKFEQMSQAFSLALDSGVGVLDKTTVVTNGDELDKDDRLKNNAEKGEKAEQQERDKLMRQEQEDLEKLKKQIDQYIKANGLTTQLDTKLNQSQLMITISDNALFPSGSAEIKPESRELALSIAGMLQQYPGYEIVVSGHTDNQPISNGEFKSNWDLSSTRAIRFMDVLLSNKSLDPKRFSAIGYGEYRPIATNDTPAGRAKNRRVEVSIIRKYTDSTTEQKIAAVSKP